MKPLNKYWCSVPHYLSDIRNIYIKADRFPLMMMTTTNNAVECKQIQDMQIIHYGLFCLEIFDFD
jgi:hypothetical protein